MQEPGDARLRLSTRLFTLGVLLLLIGHGAYRDTMHWANLFADKPLLRFVTYVGEGLGAEISDLSYYKSNTESNLTVSWLNSSWGGGAWGGTIWSSISAHRFSPETKAMTKIAADTKKGS